MARNSLSSSASQSNSNNGRIANEPAARRRQVVSAKTARSTGRFARQAWPARIVVDMDPQANLQVVSGKGKAGEAGTVYDALKR
jgi:hypothetical protein